MDKNTPQFDELLGYLAAAITAFTLKTIGPLPAIIVGFLMYHAHTWIVAFRHSRKQIDNRTASPLSSEYPICFEIAKDAFVAARDIQNFCKKPKTKADSENELNNCLRLLKGLQNAILIENYKPKQRMADSLKSLILEFSEPLPDWVYERDYLLDWIKLYSNNGSFTYITPEASIMVNSTTTKKQKRKTKKSKNRRRRR